MSDRMRETAKAGRPWFWLDGAANGTSYFGVASEVRVATRGREREFLLSLRAGSHAKRDPASLVPASPGHAERVSAELDGAEQGRFRSGWIVALGYEFGVGLMGMDPAPDEAPPAFALRVNEVSVFDAAHPDSSLRGDGRAVQEFGGDDLAREGAAREAAPGSATADSSWRKASIEYQANVEACLDSIGEGDAYVLCLTDTATVFGDFDPLSLYESLRYGGSAVRGGVIVTDDRALVSASPERFLRVSGGRIHTHPIKGTRPRGRDAAEDADLAAELADDPKERAENLMIVDLMRNDLSRVCEPGSVGVEGFLRVETHPHVHQLVSTVAGTLREGFDIFDAITACFPGGSMTGAPKQSAVEILAGLEQGPRGLYSGCFGWIDDSGEADLAMTIRSIELRGVQADREAGGVEARVGAGGGVTVDSDPARELAEKNLKAGPLLDQLARSTRHR